MQTLIREQGQYRWPKELRPEACEHVVVWVVDMSSGRVIRGACATCAATGLHRPDVPPAARIADAAGRLSEMKMEVSHAAHR